MEYELTIRGTAEDLAPVLAFLQGAPATEPSDASLQSFIADCTRPMLTVIGEIARHSILEEPVERFSLIASTRLKDEGDLNGVLGSVGRAWKKQLSSANPFIGQPGPDGGVFYKTDKDLAVKISMLAGARLTYQFGHP